MRQRERRIHWRAGHRRLAPLSLILGAALGVLLAIFAFPGVASAHATPVSASPGPRALTQGPPARVLIVFSENVNRQVARISVLNTAQQRVDSNDTDVGLTDAHRVTVDLPLLGPGTYTVVWRVQSADDGHVSSGSYYFQVARADGSAPPLPSSANGDDTASATLDGPALFQALASWAALLLLFAWVGGVLWETWILPPGDSSDPDLAAASASAARRFRDLASTFLGLLIIADVLVILGQSAAISGEWAGAIAPTQLRAILFGSHYGAYWWSRQLIALVALYLLGFANRRQWSSTRASTASTMTRAARDVPVGAIPSWRDELLATLRNVRSLPQRLAAGWRGRSLYGRVELVLGALLLLAFALSGHAAAVPADRFWYSLSVDLLHLLASALWFGGLLYISLTLLPAIKGLAEGQRARTLARGLPEFGAVAITSAVLLAATGSLNATVRMTSFAQLLTTAYGRTLVVKIELFLVMAAISAYHAFRLRPRLALALNTVNVVEEPARIAVARESGGSDSLHSADATSAVAEAGQISAEARTLARRLENWLRREALVGVGVILCVTLLAAFAGSLAAAPRAIPAANKGYVNTQPIGDNSATLKVTPAAFGPNTFVVTLKDAKGQPVTGASVLLQASELDMDMGTQSVQLQPVGADSPGVYSGQVDLAMGGNWGFVVKFIPPGQLDFQSATFNVAIGYS